MIIAHFGRSFRPYYLRKGLTGTGGAEGFYFDTSAVIDPATYDLAFSRIFKDHILYGSDLPIFFWHGRRTWTEREYHNLCRERFSWNTLHGPPEVEATYTFFLCEQMRVILDAVERHRFSKTETEGLFWGNARRALKLA